MPEWISGSGMVTAESLSAETGEPFRSTLTATAKEAGQSLDEARLDEVCRPERYLERLAPVFERLAALT